MGKQKGGVKNERLAVWKVVEKIVRVSFRERRGRQKCLSHETHNTVDIVRKCKY